jgi:hypothetical protein
MSRITLLGLLGGMLAMLVAAGAIAFEITRPEEARQSSALAEPIDAAILTTHLQNLREETALP